jgi:hypothetical protein
MELELPCVTGNHKIWTGKKWVEAKDLSPEDFDGHIIKDQNEEATQE